jgi:hypothetical protein
MGFAVGGQPYPINYVAEPQATGGSRIWPQMEVFDVTGGFPGVSQGKTALTNVKNGSYGAQFVPVTGHNYHVATDVFTDGTYTTLDPNRMGTTESVQCGQITATGATIIVGAQIDIEIQGFEMDVEIEC